MLKGWWGWASVGIEHVWSTEPSAAKRSGVQICVEFFVAMYILPPPPQATHPPPHDTPYHVTCRALPSCSHTIQVPAVDFGLDKILRVATEAEAGAGARARC